MGITLPYYTAPTTLYLLHCSLLLAYTHLLHCTYYTAPTSLHTPTTLHLLLAYTHPTTLPLLAYTHPTTLPLLLAYTAPTCLHTPYYTAPTCHHPPYYTAPTQYVGYTLLPILHCSSLLNNLDNYTLPHPSNLFNTRLHHSHLPPTHYFTINHTLFNLCKKSFQII